ncbi:protein PML-like isoform X1 [Scyliorhinus canicula]|uniref:protein PML-like isoform X1 n=1 Tax=Scyliorhinus canicula TaxID=7830 RepID=UPI0018F5F76B|nr:protein PML-like isoform X1 [Scyliorhinus canicula]
MAETASEESPLSEKLECGVCNKQLARPKLLPCLHSICQDCLQKEWASQSSSTCPVCSAPTNGDITNLQDNEFVANVLSKLQLRGRIGVELDIRCSLCQVCGDDRSATSLCFECDRFLCIRCCHSHQLLMERYGHFVKTLDDLKMINSEDFVTLARNGKQTICPNHKEQHIRFFCKTCSMSICCNCLLLYHNSPEHCYHDIKQEVVLKKEELKQMVDAIQENHNKFTETYTQLKFLEESLNIVKHNTEALIRQKASSTIQEINKQGDALLKMLETGCHSEGINLTTSLKQTEQIIIRMGAGKELAEKMLKFGTNEEMIEMYNTIKSALTALVAEMPVDVSKEGILINFTECTLETRNLLGDLVTKKEQSKEAGDCEDDEILLDTERSSGEASANLEIFPAGNELPGAPVDGSNEDEFEDMVSPSSYYPGPSDRAPFPRVMEQPEWAGEEEDRSEQPLSPHPGFSAWTRDRYPNGPSIQCESVQKHKKVPKKLGDRRPWPVEDTNTNVKRKYQHSEHNYSTTLTTESHADVTLLNITEIKHEESWRLPTDETNKISPENVAQNGAPRKFILSPLTEVQEESSSLAIGTEDIVPLPDRLGKNMSNWSRGDHHQDKTSTIQLSQELGGNPLVFFQLQTTGMEERNDIVQLSAVSGEKIFNKYIMPSIPMMEAAAAITGIQVMDGILYLRGEPQPTCSLQEAMAAFLQFLQSLDRPLLAGHNIWIRDCQILYKAWGDLFMKDQFVRCISGFLDTLWLSRNIVPRSMVKNYKLKHLVTVCVGEVFLDGTLSDVRALQELYWVLSPTPGHIQRSWFSFSQLECRVTLQPLFDQHMISRLVADQLAFKEVSLTILQLAHHNDSQSGLRDLFSTLDNLGLTNPQVAIESIRSYLEILSSKKTLRRCHRHVSHTLKVENELNNG